MLIKTNDQLKGSIGEIEAIDLDLYFLGKIKEFPPLSFYLFSHISLSSFNMNELNIVFMLI